MEDKDKVIIENGREDDRLTKINRKIYELAKKLIAEEGGDISCMMVMTDKDGGTDFMLGNPIELAKETIEVCALNGEFRQWLFAFMHQLRQGKSKAN